MKRILTIAAAALIASTAGPALAQSLGGSAGGALSGGSSGVTTDSQLSGSGTTQPRRLLPDTESAAPTDEDGAAGTAGASAASENDPDEQTNPAAPNATAGTTVQPGASGSGEAAADATTEGGDTQLRAGSSADADADQMAPSGETTASIDLTTEQRTEARQLFVDTAPVNLDINVSIGTAVPRTVEVHTLPPRFIEIVPQYRGYSYIVLADGRILILEPRTYEIVYILS